MASSVLTTSPGFIAALCFLLFTGGGALAQLWKLTVRTRAFREGVLSQDHVCDGLHPVREMWSFSAFTLFALSGLTRSQTDYFLLLSRVPVIALATGILWYLRLHRQHRAATFFFLALVSDVIVLALLLFVLAGKGSTLTAFSGVVDGLLSVVSVCLFYGKTLQARTMFRTERSQAVSYLREFGVSIKDLTGLWYSVSVGSELLWVGVTHVLSFASSMLIAFVKFVLEAPQRMKSTGMLKTMR